jgi:putative ATPase
MEDLFAEAASGRARRAAPLPDRLRPDTLDAFVGQAHVVGPGTLLRRAIEEDRVTSMILYGPPGTGKTTLARIVANATGAAFEELSAVNAGKADVTAVIERARQRLGQHGRRTILFLDEIHRFNKAQQDALLPVVESGLVTLIGATTENPYFEVNPALLSRCALYELEPLDTDDLRAILERGAADLGVALGPDAAAELARGGDARSALAALELAAATAHSRGVDAPGLEDVRAAMRNPVRYDRNGDMHYDAISAFIKSMRGSDPHAAIYWLAVMLAGGEDPKFVARRMVVFASEDVGNADPRAIEVAINVAMAVDFIGLPEGRICLAQAATYLALAPKSNAAYVAIDEALGEVRRNGSRIPPAHLRSSGFRGAEKLGRGVGYRYPHGEGGVARGQRYLPEGLEDARYYEPKDVGFEARLREVLASLEGRDAEEPEAEEPEGPADAADGA